MLTQTYRKATKFKNWEIPIFQQLDFSDHLSDLQTLKYMLNSSYHQQFIYLKSILHMFHRSRFCFERGQIKIWDISRIFIKNQTYYNSQHHNRISGYEKNC